MTVIKNVFVVGAGQMGTGIAQVFAQSDIRVLLYDQNEEALTKALHSMERILDRSVEKERISEQDKQATINNVTITNTIKDVASCDLAVEAAVENLEVKKAIFKELSTYAPSHAILATNTSSLSITEIAAVTKHPEQFIGMHFMNPVPVMKLVEIIRGLQTSDTTHQAIEAITKKINKTAVESKDYPGFVANRILMPMINEAIYTVYEGVATVEDIDTVMKLGANHPMGPLTLADFIGLDTCLYIMEVLYDGFGDSKYRPCPLLRQYVKAGWLGKKSGRGFYDYNEIR
ncbi:3-hydroxybutyryl-CoA dehydrogenase [Virgibacillus sp. W0430]|uniref:3-hydroxybutyryl-CoA dehydrogenase n=1 Tax=Virgibacillus sp. W0430 TaxID=3391580 RepID=UPI003F486CDC